MAMEAIQKVTQTEEEARRIREQAVAAARQTVAQAEREGRQIVEDARRDAQVRAKELLEKAERQAAAQTAQVLDEARADCDNLIQAAHTRLDKAAALIAERVVNE